MRRRENVARRRVAARLGLPEPALAEDSILMKEVAALP